MGRVTVLIKCMVISATENVCYDTDERTKGLSVREDVIIALPRFDQPMRFTRCHRYLRPASRD